MTPLSVETILLKAGERLEAGGCPAKTELVDVGGVSVSQDDLTLEDLVVDPDIESLLDHLAIFAPPSEIIRMHNDVFRERPELKTARKSKCKRPCDDCDSGHGDSCEEEESKED